MKPIELHDGAVNSHWHSFPDIKAFLSNLERIESWVVDDNPDVVIELERWVEIVNQVDPENLKKHGKALLIIIGFLSSSKAFFLMRQLQDRSPGLLSHLAAIAGQYINHEEYGRFAVIYLDRLNAAAAQQTLNSIYEVDRLALLNHVISKVRDEQGSLVG